MSPAPKRNPALALGILAIVLGLAWLAAARPLIAATTWQRHETGRLAATRLELARIVAERPALEGRRDALDTARSAQMATLAAESDGVAAAGLQRLVKAAIDRSGATLQSTQVKAIRPDGPYRRIGLRVQMTGSVDELLQVLQTLEANQPLIYGEGLEMRSRQQMRSNGKTAVEDRTLEIRLDVYGLARLPS